MIRDRGFYQSILRLSLPSAFQALMSLLVVMADNVMVARLDLAGHSLAAVSASNSITNFVIAAVSGLAGGTIVLVSQYWGRRDLHRIRRVYATAFAACAGLAALACSALLLFPRQAISMVISGKELEARALALQYLPIAALSYLPFALTAASIAALKGVEVVRITLYTTLCSLIANISLNYILIFGKLGFTPMGVKGAAIATVLARLLEMALALNHLLRVQKAVPPGRIMRAMGCPWHLRMPNGR